MAQNELDLSKGSVLHIEGFKTFGYEPKDKYVVIFGSESLTHVLAFTLTTTDWTTHPFKGREVIEIPKGTTSALPQKCSIKCFDQSIRLDVQRLEDGHKNHEVKCKGKLPDEVLAKLKNTVECSEDALTRMDIEDCLTAMDRDIREKK